RNRVSKEIGALMGQKKVTEADSKKVETRNLGDGIAVLDKVVATAEQARDEALLKIPNLPHSTVPIGKTAADNPSVRRHGRKNDFDFKPKTHVELCEALRLID